MSNNNDDPFAPDNGKTQFRPRPGRRQGPDPGGPVPHSAGPAPPPRSASTRTGHELPESPADFGNASFTELLTTGINPLVQAASALLVLAGRLRDQISQADTDTLRRQVTQEVRLFQDRSRERNVSPEDIRMAGYVLCTVVDEAVMNTPWGTHAGWASESLSAAFYHDTRGGKTFFDILDRTAKQTQRYIALLELLYVCLSLGFEGMYRVDPNGGAKLAQIRADLYRRIVSVRPAGGQELAPHWRGIEDRRNAVLRFVPLWIVAAASVALVIGAFIAFNTLLNSRAEPLNARLAQVGLSREEPVAQASPTVVTPGLRVTLAPQIAQGLVDVEESAGRATVTILGGNLFASGSAQMNPQFGPLMHALAAALEPLPGRIEVIGHTDDRPIHSFSYKDNYELSRDRAQHVADLIRAGLSNAARLEARGVGPSQPRYQPQSDPANEARNRRVEIIYRQGS
jgi:type VI secretion system protein ImpK